MQWKLEKAICLAELHVGLFVSYFNILTSHPRHLIYLKQISKSLLVSYFPAKTKETTKIKYMHLAQLLFATTVFFVFPLFLQKTFFIQEKKPVSWNNSSLIFSVFIISL